MPNLATNNNSPSPSAINVATSLADIGIAGFTTSRFQLPSNPLDLQLTPPAGLNPKFRLTFYICSIGFTSSILFDEQKRPYHLMIQRFDQLGGLKALFDAFYWSLTLLNTQSTTTTTSSEQTSGDYQQMLVNQDRDRLQEGTLEFIEAWLSLIQKLVNTKNMLETRYALQPTNSLYQSVVIGNNDVRKICQFDPIKFLFKIHKQSFEALLSLWDNKSFIIRENYSLSETILNILCQILVGDSQLQKKLVEQQQQQQNQATQTSSTGVQAGTSGANFRNSYLIPQVNNVDTLLNNA
jgi:E3 ubiquitin-protein ligase HUWE1